METPFFLEKTKEDSIQVRVFLILFLLTTVALGQAPGQEPVPTFSRVTFAWDPSTDTNIAGYRLHFGPASRNYTITIDCGFTTLYRVVDVLLPGETYFVAVTAYNTLGLESDYSNEISVLVKQYNPSGPSPPKNYGKRN